MTYGEERVASYCRQFPECGKALIRLYCAQDNEWQNIRNLRTVCGIDRGTWMGFNFRCNSKYGEGLTETEVGNRAGHMTNVRITSGKKERIRQILVSLYGDGF